MLCLISETSREKIAVKTRLLLKLWTYFYIKKNLKINEHEKNNPVLIKEMKWKSKRECKKIKFTLLNLLTVANKILRLEN